MRLHTVGALALNVLTVSAFQDTSPFFYFSTAELASGSPSVRQLSTSSSLTEHITRQISRCLSDAYIIVSQPQVDAADFSPAKATPRLKQAMRKHGQVRSSFSVADVRGDIDVDEMQALLGSKCDAGIMHVDASTGTFETVADMKPRVIRVEFDPLPESQPERATQLSEDDHFLSSIIDLLPSTKYTVIYSTTPSHPSSQPASSKSKRHAAHHHAHGHNVLSSRSIHADTNRRDTAKNVTLIDGPLFRKYQFFTPGLFTGLLISAPLLLILWVAISAIASLKVSYAAFDKENGPAAQNKGKIPHQ